MPQFQSVEKKNQSKKMQETMNIDMRLIAWGQKIRRASSSPQMSQPNSALTDWACPVPPHAALKGIVSDLGPHLGCRAYWLVQVHWCWN